jgi:hypothetical protein
VAPSSVTLSTDGSHVLPVFVLDLRDFMLSSSCTEPWLSENTWKPPLSVMIGCVRLMYLPQIQVKSRE